MSQIEANEQARRNYALEAFTLGEENFLQIRCGGEILTTVCAATGPAVPQFFIVHNGTGLDDDDNDLPTAKAIKIVAAEGDPAEAWRIAARYGYLHALGRMMTADQREERDLYGVAA